ncbi:streptophobe family protein [Streptomyces sp. LX-29]|uniref:streptophobe family protein n=1 Tax=Streptomyces sp. LX-29 TaxID=2900152 RepID=UPI00240D4B9D|nr:streptophobe family protein [Streptomyces sp. LX-29]WFB10232.1 streptophobe family protein [Streptomyces sp. LX-29]
MPWGELLLAAVAAVSWAFLAMAGVAALGLHLIGADGAGSLGPMTAAAVVLAVGGSVTPSGDVRVFGLEGAQAHTAIDLAPLGVSLLGALLLGWLFARSLRGAGPVLGGRELAARAGAVTTLFVLLLAGLVWAGDDTVTIDGSTLDLEGLGIGGGDGGSGGGSGTDGGAGGLLDRLPDELGDIAGIGGGLLPERLVDLADAQAKVGFTVDAGASLLRGTGWVLAVLLLTVLAARHTPLPRGWEGLHRTVRPAVSALCAVLALAVLAGAAAGVFAAVDDDHPRLVLGATLLGAPNGVWLGVPLGLFVPWQGTATGALVRVLPDPIDELLGADGESAITVRRLADLDDRVWLLAVGCALLMLTAGVLTAARTPLRVPGAQRDAGVLGFAGRCALRLGLGTALALPLLVWLTEVSAGAELSVLGFDAFGAGLDLHGKVAHALPIGAAWGVAAGAVGALLARATGAAGGRASAFARGIAARPAEAAGAGAGSTAGGGAGAAGALGALGATGGPGGYGPMGAGGGSGARTYPDLAYGPGPYRPSPVYRPSHDETNPYLRPVDPAPPPPQQCGWSPSPGAWAPIPEPWTPSPEPWTPDPEAWTRDQQAWASGPEARPRGAVSPASEASARPPGQGVWPANPDGWPAGPGPAPAGPGARPAGPGGRPAGPGGRPAGPGAGPGSWGTAPGGPGPHPAGPGPAPAAPGGQQPPPRGPGRPGGDAAYGGHGAPAAHGFPHSAPTQAGAPMPPPHPRPRPRLDPEHPPEEDPPPGRPRSRG